MHTIKTVGKAKIQMQVEGCIDCGTPWIGQKGQVAKVVDITVGKQVFHATIYRCEYCLKKNGKVTML